MDYAALTTAIIDMSSDNNDPTFVANIPVFIQNAEKRIYQAAKIPKFRKNATAYTAPSSPYLATPTDYLAPWSLATISPVYNYLLLKDVSFIREAYPNPAQLGVPKYYAQFDHDTFFIAPTPETTSQVELHYFYYPQSIVTANTTWLGDNFDNLLLYGAMVEAATFMKSDKDTMDQLVQQYSTNLKLLQDYAGGPVTSRPYR
jgi:hypothetical protein